jgi:hypothetical protein
LLAGAVAALRRRGLVSRRLLGDRRGGGDRDYDESTREERHKGVEEEVDNL